MRKLLISFILLTLCAFANAQSELVRVLYKNGGSLVGTLVSMDGTSSVIVKIAGVETTIPMEEVQSVEPYSSAETPSPKGEVTTNEQKELSDKYGDFVITDNSTDIPETFSITIDGQEIRMVLVRGGMFNMGYDDWHSGKMKSEPVHMVELSSYYISDDFISTQVASTLLHIDYEKAKKLLGDKFWCSWADAKSLVDAIAAEQGALFRLPTEAEWEYAAISPLQKTIFGRTIGYKHAHPYIYNESAKMEWCYDLFSDYTLGRHLNPTGPQMSTDNSHVARIYKDSNSKWKRHKVKSKGKQCFIRLAISANQISSQFKQNQ